MKKFALVAMMICLGFTGCDKKDAPAGGAGATAKPAVSGSATPATKAADTAAPKPTAVAPTGPGGTGAK